MWLWGLSGTTSYTVVLTSMNDMWSEPTAVIYTSHLEDLWIDTRPSHMFQVDEYSYPFGMS